MWKFLERERTNAKPSYHVLIWGIHICSFRFSTLYQLGKYGFPIFMSGKLETNKISKSKEALLRSCVQMLSVKLWDDISINDIEKFIKKPEVPFSIIIRQRMNFFLVP